MEISCTQDALLRQQRLVEDGNCDGTTKQQKQKLWQSIHCFNTKTLTIVLLLCLLGLAQGANDQNCPSMCACTVETLVFCNNKGLRTTPTDFSPEVEKLYLFNNNITTILPNTLKPLKNLKILDISGNRITNYVLWEGIFNQLKLLENIMLQDNEITRIPKSMFAGMKHLARIYIQSNQISEIESGAFDNLPSLVELKLRNNNLALFPSFQNTPNLLLLDVGFNKISRIRDMALSTVNVEHLMLQNNLLTELRTSVFDDTSRLNHLDISNNRLTAVPQIIKSLTSLRTLSMSNNKMNTIPKDTFTDLLGLKNLYLRGMSLTSFPELIIPRNVILNELDITGNNWACRCDMRWLPGYLGVFHEAFVNPEQLKCSSSSRLKNRRIMALTNSDFECTDKELETAGPASGPAATTESSSTASSRQKPHWKVDPCEVFPCFNGGTCEVVGRHPRCKCTKDWTGPLCSTSLTTLKTTRSTTTTAATTTTTTTTTQPPPPQSPRLMINPDSITDHSVQIIFPTTNTDLLVSVSEIGKDRTLKEIKIKPQTQPFTVKNLDSGRFYNICIHLSLPRGSSKTPAASSRKDTLCGSVKTSGIRVADKPASKPEITVVPSPGVATEDKTVADDNADPVQMTKKSEPDLLEPSAEEKLRGVNTKPETTPTKSSDFKLLYPAIGAGIGAVIIIIVIIMFCICRRQKRILLIKQQNGSDYVQGSPVESNHTDLEMATVVHHHHHNHYNAASADSNRAPGSTKKRGSPSSQVNGQQGSVVKAKSSPSGQIPKSAMMQNSSRSSSSSSGATQPDNHHRYSMTNPHHPPAPVAPMQYDALPPQRNAIPNDYVYRNHQSSADSMAPLLNGHCQPPKRHQSLRMVEDTQPLMGGVNSYYGANDRHMYPIGTMNMPAYIPPAGPIPYQKPNSRAVFQPIQTPTALSSSSSESMPISPRVSTAHVLPTAAACLSRNLVSDSMSRYHEGVQVV